MKEKRQAKVKEEILRRIKAKTAKIKGYQQRVSQFQQNRFFINNKSWFNNEVYGSEEGEEIVILDAQEVKTFWTDTWGQEVELN